jgi:hypothetical protein
MVVDHSHALICHNKVVFSVYIGFVWGLECVYMGWSKQMVMQVRSSFCMGHTPCGQHKVGEW